MRALIDADIIVYQCGFAAETMSYEIRNEIGLVDFFQYKKQADKRLEELGEGYYLTKEMIPEPLENALHNVKVLVKKIQEATKCDSMTMYLTGGKNYRDAIATIKPYKGNRDNAHKPFWYEEIKKYLKRNYDTVETDGIEADDAMGIEQINNYFPKITHLNDTADSDTIICSRDKDMNMIAGWHYNWSHDGIYWVDQDTADEWFYCQLITGDTADNITGVPKAGAKAAQKLLLECSTNEERYSSVLALYETAYGDDGAKVLKENAQLLWIQREKDTMWEPPSGRS